MENLETLQQCNFILLGSRVNGLWAIQDADTVQRGKGRVVLYSWREKICSRKALSIGYKAWHHYSLLRQRNLSLIVDQCLEKLLFLSTPDNHHVGTIPTVGKFCRTKFSRRVGYCSELIYLRRSSAWASKKHRRTNSHPVSAHKPCLLAYAGFELTR